MNHSFRATERTFCRICGSARLEVYLDLGQQPPSNSFIDPADAASEQRFPLAVALCRDCGLSQLTHVVAAADIFDDYLYLSSTSKALRLHYEGLVGEALAAFAPADGSLCVDIGCNDGVLLKGYPSARFRLLGIEPSSAGRYAREAGFAVEPCFFDAAAGARIAGIHGQASLVTTTNVFAHVDDIDSFCRGVRSLLAPDGVFIIEFPYLGDMLTDGYFDTVYHEHLSYLALTPLLRLFSRAHLRAFRVSRIDLGASGPALRLFVCRDEARHPTESSIDALVGEEAAWGVREPAAYRAFAARVDDIRQQIRSLIATLHNEGLRIGAFGAPAKGNTLLNSVGLGPRDIVVAAENSPLKIGKLMPGSHIPIVSDEDFLAAGIDVALLLTWNYLSFFLQNAEFIKRGGRFLVPFPTPCLMP